MCRACNACVRRPLRMPPQSEAPAGRAASKGLRHFSMKVCQKVESKGRTTYNEVADELVRDFSTPPEPGAPLCPTCYWSLSLQLPSAVLCSMSHVVLSAPEELLHACTCSHVWRQRSLHSGDFLLACLPAHVRSVERQKTTGKLAACRVADRGSV